jgi:hypothetical protein
LSTIFMWPVNSTSASSGSEGIEDVRSGDTESIDISVLVSALKKAEDEIEDEDLKAYYRTLIDRYDLENNLEDETLDAPYVEALPDIDHIVRVAIATPLEEAGKNIKDPEIKEFYNDFMKDVGWEFAREQE